MSFTAPTRERPGPAMPMAGMIDIMFLLLVFFMSASAFRDRERQIDISLPEARESAGGERIGIIITVEADGTIHMTGSVYSFDTLEAKLGELAKQFPNEPVVIRGDRKCPWGTVVRVIDIAHVVGLRNVSAATTKLASEL